jgi:Flp pilus assembly protein TadD
MLAALRRSTAETAVLDELEARLLLREARIQDALTLLDQAVTAAPDSVPLRICRADARAQADRFSEAAADAAEAVVLAPCDAQAKAMLGAVLIELGRAAEAVTCLAEAVAQEPFSGGYRLALAEALERGGDAAAATAALAEGIIRAPGDARLRVAAIMVAIRHRDFTAAIELAQAAQRAGVVEACVLGLLGHSLSALGRHDEAHRAYAEALKLTPEDPYIRHLVQSSGALPANERAPSDYLEVVFDGYADHFEPHLIGLGYRVPGLIRAALAAHPALQSSTRFGPILDLGCGTGLAVRSRNVVGIRSGWLL